jgi:mono/diheme cytochrome c family protein
MHETLFFICGGILAASAIVVSFIGLKNDDFPGKMMPLVILWFAVFAVAAGTFAVLHGKDESKDHDAEYAKASKEIQFNETKGPFVEEQKEEAEAEGAESTGENGPQEQESEAGTEVEGGETEGEGGEQQEEPGGGEAEGGSGNAEAGTVVFSENCSTCHGATGHGGGGGPDLTTMPLAQTEAGAIQQVTNGGGGMPPFGGTLSEEEIENVAAYVVQEITHGE